MNERFAQYEGAANGDFNIVFELPIIQVEAIMLFYRNETRIILSEWPQQARYITRVDQLQPEDARGKVLLRVYFRSAGPADAGLPVVPTEDWVGVRP